jgi:formamidopyrimidine-DNA glycosylase
MPELPEVETICRGIEPAILNKKISTVVIRQHQLRWSIEKNLPIKLKNQTVKSVTRRGKYLLFTLNSGTLIIHLGMSGSLQLLPKEHTVQKHDHVDIVFNTGQCLCFNDPRRFGAILWTEQNPLQHKLLTHLGLEPLDAEFTAEYLFAKTKNHTTPIKTFIMNSKIVTGVGNIYANEALFLAEINPTTSAKQLTLKDCQKLVTAIKKVLQAAIKHGGTTFRDYKNSKGEKGLFKEKLQVYARGGKTCLKCGSAITATRLGQRSTYHCPKCQKL